MWGLTFTFYSPEELERQLRSFGFYVPEEQVLEPGDWRSELYILARDALIQNNRAKNGMEKIQMTIQNYRDAIDAFQNGAEVSINNEQVSFNFQPGLHEPRYANFDLQLDGLKVELENGLSEFKKVLDAWISSLGLDSDQAVRLKARFDKVLDDYEKQITNMEINLVELDKLYKVGFK